MTSTPDETLAASGVLPTGVIRRLRGTGAFSLIEVVMAIGITAFAAFAIAGLIPVGMSSFRQTKNVSVASQISRQVLSELQSASFNQILISGTMGGTQATVWRMAPPPPPGTQTPNYVTNGTTNNVRYFDDQGAELQGTSNSTTSSGVPAGTIYEVNVGVRFAPYVQPSNTGQTGNATNNCLVIVTVQVAYNPGLQSLDMSQSNSSLWSGTANNGAIPVQIYTYQTMIAGDPTPNT